MYFAACSPLVVVLSLFPCYCKIISTLQIEVLKKTVKKMYKIISVGQRCWPATINIQHGALTTSALEPKLLFPILV